MQLDPGGLLAWIVIGLIAGALASLVVRGGEMGIIGDLIIGIVGAFLGGFLASLLGFGGSQGFVGTLVVAFIGAVVLLLIINALSGLRTRTRI